MLPLISSPQAANSTDGLAALLTTGADELQEHRSVLVASATQADENRMLRQEQDREYEEALAKDREMEAQRRLEEEKRKQAQDLEKQAELRRQQSGANLIERRKQMVGSVVPNCDREEGPKSKIQVRFPAGQRVGRGSCGEVWCRGHRGYVASMGVCFRGQGRLQSEECGVV